jgi:Mrp family chromosome partitioning ATPase
MMNQLLNKLKNVADYVIIDCPPFIIADAMILAAKVDGVLLVIRPGHTRQPLAEVTMEQLSQVEANLIGVVLNRIPRSEAVYYAGKGHLYTHNLSNYGLETKIQNDKTNGNV